MRDCFRFCPTLAPRLLAIVILAPVLLGQAPSGPTPQSLFDEARTLLQEGAVDAACRKLTESYRLDPALGTLLNLADCEERRGRVAAAWSVWLEASALARAANQPEREAFARSRAEALRASLGTLSIVLASGVTLDGLRVMRDDVLIEPSAFGKETPVDPGEHVVAVSAPGYQSWTNKVFVSRGLAVHVKVPELNRDQHALPAASSSARTSEAAPAGSARGEPQPSAVATIYRTISWATGLLGLALLLVLASRQLFEKSRRAGSGDSTLPNAGVEKSPRWRQVALVAAIAVVIPPLGYLIANRVLALPSQNTSPEDAAGSHQTVIRIAGDPWSGYSTFRGEPRLSAELAKRGIRIEYVDDPALYDQDARMKALAEGRIDAAVTTIDALLQHGTKHKIDGLLPGVIVWNIDESNGGDAIFLAKGRQGFDSVLPTDKVCYSSGTPSEHLWDFASLSFATLGDGLATDNGVVASDCWKKLTEGQVQVAVLWQPSTAIAAKAGFPKAFATGGQADDVIIDVFVVGRAFLKAHPDAIAQLTAAYFRTIDFYVSHAEEHATFVTKDCGQDCADDVSLGRAVLEGIDFLTFEENLCLWWGQCGAPEKMSDRIKKTARLLMAKGKLPQDGSPDPRALLDVRFLLEMKKTRDARSELAAEVVGQGTAIRNPKLDAREKSYTYLASTTVAHPSTEVGTLKLPNIYFPEGRADLDQNARSVVDIIAEQLRAFPALCVRVYGHTNSAGDPQSNRRLSEARALSIVNYLTALDGSAFPRSRFDVQGFGSAALVLRENQEDFAASRRTEFKLFNCAREEKTP